MRAPPRRPSPPRCRRERWPAGAALPGDFGSHGSGDGVGSGRLPRAIERYRSTPGGRERASLERPCDPPTPTSSDHKCEITACRACPRLVAWRERWPRAAAAFPPRTTGGGRCPGSATRARRSCSSGWRRRRTGRTGPGGCSPATARATGSTRRCTGRVSANQPTSVGRGDGLRLRGARDRRGPVRPAGEQADPGRARHCRPWLDASSAAPDRCGCSSRSGAFGWDAALRALAGGGPCPGRAALRSRRRDPARRADPARQLPPEPAEHVHRPTHRGDARRRARPAEGWRSGAG